MKKSMLFLCLLMFIFPVMVNAENSRTEGYDKCIQEGTCLLICEYENIYKSVTYDVNVYYHLDTNEWEIGWFHFDNMLNSKEIKYATKVEKNLLPTDGVFYENSELKVSLQNEGVCPKSAYSDNHRYSLKNEVCFDNGNSYCKSESNMGTTFDGTSKLVSDITDNINEFYVTNGIKNSLMNYDCLSISENYIINTTTANEFSQKMVKYIRDNYFSDYKYPSFYADKFNNFIDNVIRKDITNKIDSCQLKLNDLAKDNLNDEEYEEHLKNVENTEIQLDVIFSNIINDVFDGILNLKEILDCESLLGDPNLPDTPSYYLVVAFNVIKYVAILLLIVLTVIDFVGAVLSQDNDQIKKSFSKAMKRLMLCVLIFLLPTLLEFILQFINDRQIDLCGIGGK